MIGQHINTAGWSIPIARSTRQGRLRRLLAAVRARLTAAGPVASRLRQAQDSLERATKRRPSGPLPEVHR